MFTLLLPEDELNLYLIGKDKVAVWNILKFCFSLFTPQSQQLQSPFASMPNYFPLVLWIPGVTLDAISSSHQHASYSYSSDCCLLLLQESAQESTPQSAFPAVFGGPPLHPDHTLDSHSTVLYYNLIVL